MLLTTEEELKMTKETNKELSYRIAIAEAQIKQLEQELKNRPSFEYTEGLKDAIRVLGGAGE